MQLDIYLKKQIFIVSWICLGQSLVGYTLGWTSPIIPKLQDGEKSPLPDVITDREASFLGSVYYIGTIIGPNISGYLSNKIGRKPCLMLGGALTLMSFIVETIAINLAMIYTGRIIKGLGVGIIAVGNLIYIGEIASSNIRGILLTMTGIVSNVGNLLIYSVGPFVSYRATGYIGATITSVYIVSLFFIPETPVYMILKGKEDEAKIVLEYLGRNLELTEVKSTTESIKENKSNYAEIFKDKSNKKALFILLTLNILQQMSGVIIVTFFATQIFTLAGSDINPDTATIIIGLSQLISSCIAPFFVDRTGRKTLLLLSTSICAGSLTVFGVYFFMYERDYTVAESLRWLPLVTLVIFFLAYNFGFGIIPNTLTGEMFTLRVRSSGSALALTVSWLVGFILALAFNDLIPIIGASVTFWIFAGSCALASIFTIFFVPETKGKSLQEIQELLSK